MFIIRLISFILFLAGLAVVAAGGWLLMGNRLEIPANPMFGPQAEMVERTLPADGIAPAAAPIEADSAETAAEPKGKSSGAPTASSKASDGFQVQMLPSSRGFSTADPLDDLREVPIAYAAPEKAQFARPFEVTVAIDATEEADPAAVLPSGTRQVEDTARVTEKVRATISGAAFDIETITPDTQIISDQAVNVWRWKVTPRNAGSQELVVELFGFRGEDALPIRTYRDSVTIEVTRVGQVIALAEQANPVAVFLGGVGSVLAGFFGFVRLFRR